MLKVVPCTVGRTVASSNFFGLMGYYHELRHSCKFFLYKDESHDVYNIPNLIGTSYYVLQREYICIFDDKPLPHDDFNLTVNLFQE